VPPSVVGMGRVSLFVKYADMTLTEKGRNGKRRVANPAGSHVSQKRNWPLLITLFSRIAVSEIRYGERKQFQATVIMDTHGPSRPLLVE
jgi:hypothetical protein